MLEVVPRLEGRFDRPLPGGPYPEPSTSAVMLPLVRRGAERPYGLVIAGVSSRRELDDAYRTFFTLASEHVATAIANARAFEEERRRAQQLAELDRAKTAFFSNVSHEFRTPLTLMLGPVEDILADAELASHHRDALALTHRNGLRLRKLVNTLLDFSRIEAGRIEASYEPVDLGAIHRGARQRVPRCRRQSRLTLRRRLRGRRRAGLCRSRDVGEGRPQPRFERLQVHARGRDRGCRSTERLVCDRDGARHWLWHSDKRAAAHLRTVPSRGRDAGANARRHRDRAGAGSGTGQAPWGNDRGREHRRLRNDGQRAHAAWLRPPPCRPNHVGAFVGIDGCQQRRLRRRGAALAARGAGRSRHRTARRHAVHSGRRRQRRHARVHPAAARRSVAGRGRRQRRGSSWRFCAGVDPIWSSRT